MGQSQNEINSREYSEKDFLNWLISGADEIRKRLRIGESDFQFLGRAHNSRGRDHYIYAVLDEIEQVTFALMLTQEHFSKAPDDSLNDELGRRLNRNLLSGIESEQS